MGISERKQRHKENIRETILAAAQAIVLKDGLASVTLRRVAEEVEYSPGAIYLYFKNRDEIVRELGRRGVESLVKFLQRSEGTEKPEDRLMAMALDYVRYAAEHAETYRLIFMLDPDTADAIFQHDDGKSGAGSKAFEILVESFTQLRDSRKRYASLNPVDAAEIFWTSLHGIASLKISCSKFLTTPAEDLIKANITALLRGLGEGR